jgi:hypothetical protein
VSCDRFERERLADVGDAAGDEHLATCASCRAAAGRYARVAGLVADAGRERPLPDGWDERLLARLVTDRRRRPRWIVPAAAVAVVAAAAVAALLLWPDPGPPSVALAARIEEGAGGRRAAVPRPGDRVAIDARTGRWRHAELRLYRNDRELAARCADAPPCRRDGDRLSATFALDAVGRYRVLLVVGNDRAPEPSGAGLDADATAAAGGGEVRLGAPIDVQ